MARLTYSERKSLPKSDFAVPSKRSGGKGGYPIVDKAHARNALARVAQHGSPAEKAEVRAKVHRKFPGIGEHMKDGKSEKRSHKGMGDALMKRGHFSNQGKAPEMSHADFHAMDHGDKNDHMVGRKKDVLA